MSAFVVTVPTLVVVLPILAVLLVGYGWAASRLSERFVKPWVHRRLIAKYGSCTCPDDESGPWDPDWDGETSIDPACPYHGTRA